MTRAPLALIVAMSKDRAIGRKGQLPWHLPVDLKRFKALTSGHAIIMGRRTHQSIGRALPGRRNLVVSRTREAQFEGCEVFGSLEEAVAAARSGDERPFVIGGGELYERALPLATALYLTEVDVVVPDADTWFPRWSASEWREVQRVPAEGCVFVDYVRAQ